MSNQSPNYRLSKSTIQQTPISRTCNIQKTQTSEVWRAKVFNLQQVNQYNMLSSIQYNQQVFHFLKDNYQNSLYLQSCFEKNGSEYMVFEYWTERLSDYINNNLNRIKDKTQVGRILKDVLLSICDIYAEDFMILNLRPEHIVKVTENDEDLPSWKIESLVYDYVNHGLPSKCEYEFDYQWASNQEKAQKENLQDKFKDQQIVWYMGILALRLIYGSKFKLNAKFKDSDINETELKEKCLPQVYELIQKSVKANLRHRIPLKSFLNLAVFKGAEISSEVKEKFISGNILRIKKSEIMKNSVSQKMSLRQSNMNLPPKPKSPLKQSSLTQPQASKLFQQLRWALQKCFYLGEIKQYTQSAASIDQTSKEDKIVIRYLYFKLAALNLERLIQSIKTSAQLKTFRESIVSRELYKDLLNCIEEGQKSVERKPLSSEAIEYQKKMRILDPKKLNILSDCQEIVIKLKKSIENARINPEELSEGFSIMNGKFFSSLKTLVEKTESSKIQLRGIKIRALCYFVFSSYIVLIKPQQKSPSILNWLLKNDFCIYHQRFFMEQKLTGSIDVKFLEDVEYIRLCEFTSQGKERVLIDNSQTILKKYFKTVQNSPTKQAEINEIKKESKPIKKVSFGVSNKIVY